MDMTPITPESSTRTDRARILRIALLVLALLALLGVGIWFALPAIKERQAVQEGEKRRAILEEFSQNAPKQDLTFEERQAILDRVSGNE